MSRAVRTMLLLCVLAFGIISIIIGVDRMPEWVKGVSQIILGMSFAIWSIDRLLEPKEKR